MYISEQEKAAIRQVMQAGQKFGFGNLIGWLNTAWVKELMETLNISESEASKMIHGSSYPVRWLINLDRLKLDPEKGWTL